jgi:hypothetical protein
VITTHHRTARGGARVPRPNRQPTPGYRPEAVADPLTTPTIPPALGPPLANPETPKVVHGAPQADTTQGQAGYPVVANPGVRLRHCRRLEAIVPLSAGLCRGEQPAAHPGRWWTSSYEASAARRLRLLFIRTRHSPQSGAARADSLRRLACVWFRPGLAWGRGLASAGLFCRAPSGFAPASGAWLAPRVVRRLSCHSPERTWCRVARSSDA